MLEREIELRRKINEKHARNYGLTRSLVPLVAGSLAGTIGTLVANENSVVGGVLIGFTAGTIGLMQGDMVLRLFDRRRDRKLTALSERVNPIKNSMAE